MESIKTEQVASWFFASHRVFVIDFWGGTANIRAEKPLTIYNPPAALTPPPPSLGQIKLRHSQDVLGRPVRPEIDVSHKFPCHLLVTLSRQNWFWIKLWGDIFQHLSVFRIRSFLPRRKKKRELMTAYLSRAPRCSRARINNGSQ